MAFEYLDLADYLLIAESVLGVDAERLAELPRVVNLASSALAAPQAGFGGHEAYPEFTQKAGLLAARLAKNHPLPDGNKRASLLALVEFAERNGYKVDLSATDAVVEVMLSVASGAMSEADFVDWLKPLMHPALEDDLVGGEVVCATCRGSGRQLAGAPCDACDGEGYQVKFDLERLDAELAARGWSDDDLAAAMSLDDACPGWSRVFPGDWTPSRVLNRLLHSEEARQLWDKAE